MRIYYKVLGYHVHCRVFTTALCGTLVFSLREWTYVKDLFIREVQFIEDKDGDQEGNQT